MTHEITYYGIQAGLSLIGSATYISWILKKESDKFDNKKANFNDDRFIKKNKYDFVFYILSGLVMLSMKSLVRSYIGIEEITDGGISVMCGLFGALILDKLFSKK